MKKLDLSSYSEQVTYAEMRPYLQAMLRPNFGKLFVVAVAVIMSIVVLGSFYQAGMSGWAYLWFALVAIAILVIVAAALRYAAQNRVRLQRMADRNGIVASFDQKEPELNGMYFQTGYDRMIVERLDIPEQGITLGVHQYVTGSGKNRQTHMVGFARCTLTRALPHIVLDNVKNNFWKFSNLPVQYESDQKLSLEGDFDKYFTLYAPKDYETDALYIFTPDVMAAFVDSGYTVDAEIVDNYLYVYCENSPRLTNEKFVTALYDMIQKIGDKLETQSDYYKDERVTSREANVVAAQGRRLKPGFSYLTLIGIAVYILVQLFSHNNGEFFTISGPVILSMLFIVIFVVIMVVSRRK